jgi:hypothetical protein
MGGGSAGASANNPVYVYDISGGGGGMGGMGGGQEGGGIFGSILGGVKSVFGGISDTVSSVFGGIGDAIGGIFGGGGGGGGYGGFTPGFGDSGYSNNDGYYPFQSSASNMDYGSFGGGYDSGSSDMWSGGGYDPYEDFGGYFANGGTLGAGKWGIAGEMGPEVVSGPASISPMSGTNVTYNINAVDAASFKQMIAQDPSFIYAVSQQGAAGVPGRR